MINDTALGSLYRGQPNTVHADAFKRGVLPRFLHQLLQQRHQIGVLVGGNMVGFGGGEHQLVDGR
ncbi:hypothetical protein D3C72_1880810 [compost metagenome]